MADQQFHQILNSLLSTDNDVRLQAEVSSLRMASSREVIGFRAVLVVWPQFSFYVDIVKTCFMPHSPPNLCSQLCPNLCQTAHQPIAVHSYLLTRRVLAQDTKRYNACSMNHRPCMLRQRGGGLRQ